LLFMGEEHDETAPFQFFTDHVDPEIAEATRAGRKREFEAFGSFGEEVPDPQHVETFERSCISHRPAEPLYADLIALRRTLPRELDVQLAWPVLTLRRGDATLVADLGSKTVELRA
jgi:maltooligosyltrehalose trehalohydrolase